MTLTYDIAQPDVRRLVEMLATGMLVPAGVAGGPAWTPQRQALLFASLESGWPIGLLVAWIPAGMRRWYLLDGHRRAATVSALRADGDGGLLRYLAVDQPTYLPATGAPEAGPYLPVAAMLSTLRFLAATRPLAADAVHRAERFAASVIDARCDIVVLSGGTAELVQSLCERLIPGRVDPIVLQALTARVHHHGDPSGPASLP